MANLVDKFDAAIETRGVLHTLLYITRAKLWLSFFCCALKICCEMSAPLLITALVTVRVLHVNMRSQHLTAHTQVVWHLPFPHILSNELAHWARARVCVFYNVQCITQVLFIWCHRVYCTCTPLQSSTMSRIPAPSSQHIAGCITCVHGICGLHTRVYIPCMHRSIYICNNCQAVEGASPDDDISDFSFNGQTWWLRY